MIRARFSFSGSRSLLRSYEQKLRGEVTRRSYEAKLREEATRRSHEEKLRGDLQHCRAFDRIILQCVQRAVCFFQRIQLHSRLDWDLRGNAQKVFTVLPCIVGHA